ncbi:MAG: hypothetical protein D4R88_04895, partial [Methanosarcinales archaeon]
MKKIILLVAMPDSIHTARWVNQIPRCDFEIRLFPSTSVEIPHPELVEVTMEYSFLSIWRERMRLFGFSRAAFLIDWVRRHYERQYPNYRVMALLNAINKLNPLLIHSIEIQSAGYLTLEAKRRCKTKFPPWMVTNWGSDIFLFGRLQAHKDKICDVLSHCDFYSCECHRDVNLAKSFGFKGTV